MKPILIVAGVIIGCLAIALQPVQSDSKRTSEGSPGEPPRKNQGDAPSPSDHAADEAAIRANIAEFAKAYNAGDAKPIAALFTEDGQIIDKQGDESAGRAAIAQTFADLFKGSPQKRIQINVESLRFLGPDLAMETGTTKETSADQPAEIDRYTVLHVKRDGKWRMAMARDEEGPSASGHEQLRALAWLVGDWIDDGGSSVVASSCRWSPDGKFLLQDFKLKINGRDALNVSQRIGWDPVAKRIRSWVFDSEGGYGESAWNKDGSGWLIRATGVRPDGTTASATNFLTPVGANGYVWRSTNRVVAGDREQDVQVKVVRQAPEPKETTSRGTSLSTPKRGETP